MEARVDTRLTLALDPLFKEFRFGGGARKLNKALVGLAARDPARIIPVFGKLQQQSAHVLERAVGHTIYFASDTAKAPINRYEWRIYSQNGEDGMIMSLFSSIGAEGKTFVEIGSGEGKECNTANLTWNLGWRGLLVDVGKKNTDEAQSYYRELTRRGRGVRILRRRVTAENINDIIGEGGMRGNVDLLSIDIDGNDYWVWKATTQVAPSVVVIEYNASLGPTNSLTVRYNPDLTRGPGSLGLYHGASITALTKLGESKGYALLGCDSSGVNAFFIMRDLLPKGFRSLLPEEAFYPHSRRSRVMSQTKETETVLSCDWVQV